MIDKNTLFDGAPDQLWNAVCYFAEQGGVPSRTDEPEIHDGVQFLKAWEKASVADFRRLKKVWPDLFSAHQMHIGADMSRWVIEAGVLARVEMGALADYCGRSRSVVETYVRYFFDAADRLDAPGWVLTWVMHPAAARGIAGRTFDLLYKTIAYHCGWKFFQSWVLHRRLDRQTRQEFREVITDKMLRLGHTAILSLDQTDPDVQSAVIKICSKMLKAEDAKSKKGKGGTAQGSATPTLDAAIAAIIEDCRKNVLGGPLKDPQLLTPEYVRNNSPASRRTIGRHAGTTRTD